MGSFSFPSRGPLPQGALPPPDPQGTDIAIEPTCYAHAREHGTENGNHTLCGNVYIYICIRDGYVYMYT